MEGLETGERLITAHKKAVTDCCTSCKGEAILRPIETMKTIYLSERKARWKTVAYLQYGN